MTTLDLTGIITRVCTDLKGKFASKNELSAKQDKLISGTNIKTVNGESLLGSGGITISGGGGSASKIIPFVVYRAKGTYKEATVTLPGVGPDDIVTVIGQFPRNNSAFTYYGPTVKGNVNGTVTLRFNNTFDILDGVGFFAMATPHPSDLHVYGALNSDVSNRDPVSGENIEVSGSGQYGSYTIGYEDIVTGENVTVETFSDVTNWSTSFVMPNHSVKVTVAFSGGGNN